MLLVDSPRILCVAYNTTTALAAVVVFAVVSISRILSGAYGASMRRSGHVSRCTITCTLERLFLSITRQNTDLHTGKDLAVSIDL